MQWKQYFQSVLLLSKSFFPLMGKNHLAEIKTLVAKARVQSVILHSMKMFPDDNWYFWYYTTENILKNVRNTGNTSFWSLSDGFFVYSSLVFCKKTNRAQKSSTHSLD